MEEEALSFQSRRAKSVQQFILIALLAVILIPLSVYAAMYVTELRSKALPTENPESVEVTNITDSTVSISWVTPSLETIGYIKYGKSSSEVDQVVLDKRDADEPSGSYSVHYVDVPSLDPSTDYYYAIVVGGTEYKRSDDEYYRFKTGPTLEEIQTPQPVKGIVEDPTNSSEEVLVYLYVEKEDQISNKISTLTTNMKYTLDLSNLRFANLREYFTDLENAKLFIYANGAERGEGNVQTEIMQAEE